MTVAGLVDIPFTTTGNNIANSNTGSIYLNGVTASQANYSVFGIKAFTTTENIFSWVKNNGTLAGWIDFQGIIFANSGLTASSIISSSNIVFPNTNTGLLGNNNGTVTFNTKNTYWESNTKIDYATDISGTYTSRSLVDKAYVDSKRVQRLAQYTVATLPTGVQGDNAYVTDALAPTYMATVVGGGSVVTPVFYNGSSWIAH
jgi:hypothetical protein